MPVVISFDIYPVLAAPFEFGKSALAALGDDRSPVSAADFIHDLIYLKSSSKKLKKLVSFLEYCLIWWYYLKGTDDWAFTDLLSPCIIYASQRKAIV